MNKNLAVLEALPISVSMRKSAIKVNGGDLDNFWDVPRWDGCGVSRTAAHMCRKDWRINARHDHDMRRTRRAVRAMKEGVYGSF